MGRCSPKDKPESPSFGFRVSRIELEPETLNPELETIFRLLPSGFIPRGMTRRE